MKTICKIIGAIDKNLGSFLGGMCLGASIYGWTGMIIGGIFAVIVILYSANVPSI